MTATAKTRPVGSLASRTSSVGPFASRHIGPQADERDKMLAALGLTSLEDLVDQAMPSSIRVERPLALPAPLTEAETLARLHDLAAQNRPLRAMIGLGYYGTTTPPVIRRNVLEAPAWYTAYTPYQPEISQGRLEALLNF
jgi:glycine dehydrogenase